MTIKTAHEQAHEKNTANGKSKVSAAHRFWYSLEEIAGARFSSWPHDSIPKSEGMSKLIRSLRLFEPELVTPLAIAILKRGGTQTSSSFRELIAQMRRVPKDHERALLLAMINHPNMKKHEGIFELYDHAHWIHDSQVRRAITSAGIDATPAQLREKVAHLKVKEPHYSPMTITNSSTKNGSINDSNHSTRSSKQPSTRAHSR